MQNFILQTLDLLQYHYSARYPGKRKKLSDAGRKGKCTNPVPVSQHFAGLVQLDTVLHTLCPRFDKAVDSGDALTGVSWTVLVLTLSCRLSKFYQCQEDDKAVTQGLYREDVKGASNLGLLLGAQLEATGPNPSEPECTQVRSKCTTKCLDVLS